MTESSDPTQPVQPVEPMEPMQPEAPMSAPLAPPPATTPAPPVPRPGPSGALVTAAVIQLVIATLLGLFAILFIVLGALLGQMPDVFEGSGLTPDETQAITGIGAAIVIVLGFIALGFAVAHLLGGIGALKRWGWARILGIVTSVLGVLLWLLVLVSNLVAATQRIPAGYLDNSGLTVEEYRKLVGLSSVIGIGLAAVVLAAYTFVLVVLIRRGSEFS